MISLLKERSGKGSALRIGIGLGMIGLAVLLDGRGKAPIRVGDLRHPFAGSRNPIDFFAYRDPDSAAATLADAGLYGGPALPLFLSLHRRPRPEYPRILLASFEMLLLTFGATSVIKNTANRPRPYVLAPNFPANIDLIRNHRAAFLSGHAAMAAAGSMHFALLVSRYSRSEPVQLFSWGVAGFVAGATGYLRVKAAKHWPTDAMAGILLGFGIATAIFNIQFSGALTPVQRGRGERTGPIL